MKGRGRISPSPLWIRHRVVPTKDDERNQLAAFPEHAKGWWCQTCFLLITQYTLQPQVRNGDIRWLPYAALQREAP